MSSIQSPNSFWLVGFLYRLLGNRVWPVRGVRSSFNALKSKRCYGNNDLKVRLKSLSFDNYCMYILIVTKKKLTDPEL